MPHQQHIVDVALEIDPSTGELAYRMVIVVMPRQQGKTELLLPLMTHRSMGFGPKQRILYTAQTGAEARKKWEDVHVARLLESPLKSLFVPRLRLTAEAIVWTNGSMWSPIATTKKTGGTGDSIDLGVIDEAWAREDDGMELAMRPAMLTRKSPQLWAASMVPGLTRAKTVNSRYLRDKMKLGRQLVRDGVNQGIAYFEFSAPPGMDPGDPETWATCMPALNRTVSVNAIQADYLSMLGSGQLVDFQAEYLSWWPDDSKPIWTVIVEGVWNDLLDAQSQPSGRIAFGIAAPDDRSCAWVAAVGRRADRDYHVEVVEPGQHIAEGMRGLDWLRNRVIELCNVHDPLCVVVDPRSPAASEIIPLRQNGIEVLTPNTLQYAASCGRFYDATGQEARTRIENGEDYVEIRGVRLHHLGQRELTRAVAGVSKLKSPTQGTFTWSRVGSTVDIGPLEAVTLAMFGYEDKAPDDYDILDSIPLDESQCPECEAWPEAPGWPLIHRPGCSRRNNA